MNQFEQLGFAPAYMCEANPEYSGDGSARMLLFIRSGRTLTGSGLCVSVEPDHHDSWMGTFDWDNVDYSRICACPNPNHLCVIARGCLYIVDVTSPEKCLMPNFGPVTDMIAVPTREKLLFADFTNLLSLGPHGIEWVSERISSDGIAIDWVNDTLCRVIGWSAASNKEVNVEIDLQTGAVINFDIDPAGF